MGRSLGIYLNNYSLLSNALRLSASSLSVLVRLGSPILECGPMPGSCRPVFLCIFPSQSLCVAQSVHLPLFFTHSLFNNVLASCSLIMSQPTTSLGGLGELAVDFEESFTSGIMDGATDSCLYISATETYVRTSALSSKPSLA